MTVDGTDRHTPEAAPTVTADGAPDRRPASSAARWAGLLDELGVPPTVLAAAPGSTGPGGVPSGGECAEALGQVFEYLDGEVTELGVRTRIGEHLELCTTCLAAYDTEKLVRAALVRSCRSEHASEELRTRISILIHADRS